MAKRTKKLTHADFQKRLKRIAGGGGGTPGLVLQGATHPRDTRQRPLISFLLGFAWIYGLFMVATNKDIIQSSLAQGNLSADIRMGVMAVLAGLLVISAVMLLVHLARFIMSTHMRRSRGGLLIGALGAAGFVHTPPEMVGLGYAMLDDNARALLFKVQNMIASNDFLAVAGLG